MLKMLEADDAALDEAGRSGDEDIRRMALYVRLDRVRELVGAAKTDSYLWKAHDHCVEAFKIAESGYKAMQVSYVPDHMSIANKDLFLLPRGEGGVYVQKTVPQSAAAIAGLLPGDIILAVDTQKMKNGEELKVALAGLAPGIPVQITFLRAEPLAVPELPLTCGILEYARKEKGLAQMNLAQWLNSKPEREEIEKVSSIVDEVTQ
jgi:membrane-associated protease RseP (regulator of RpoE activity)